MKLDLQKITEEGVELPKSETEFKEIIDYLTNQWEEESTTKVNIGDIIRVKSEPDVICMVVAQQDTVSIMIRLTAQTSINNDKIVMQNRELIVESTLEDKDTKKLFKQLAYEYASTYGMIFN